MRRRVRGQGRLGRRSARVSGRQGRQVVDPRDVCVHRRGAEDERGQVRQEGAAPAPEGRRARAGGGDRAGVTNAERVQAMYERFWGAGDWRAGTDLFADDVEWIGIDDVGLSGERHGAREVAGFFREWLEAWDDYSNDADVEEITPDVVLVTSRFRGRGKGSGIEFET